MKNPLLRAKYVFIGFFTVYISLVATHKGEFWPFSIFPMFSQAGKSWDRTIVREIDQSEVNQIEWKSYYDQEELPGAPYALAKIGMDQNDLAGFVRNTSEWTKDRINSLQSFFKEDEQSTYKIIFSVIGEWDSNKNEVRLIYTPILALNGSVYFIE